MIEINLLGDGSKKGKSESRKKIVLELPNYVTFSIVLVVIEIVALLYVTYSMNKAVDNLQKERNKLGAIEKQVKRVRVKVREVNNMIKAVKSLEKGRGKAAKILEEIADAIPQGMIKESGGVLSVGGSLWLVGMSKKGNTIYIEGKSFTAEAVANYMMSLEALKDVKKVRFSSGGLRKSASRNGMDIYAFSIVVTLKG